jgi:uncharacterized phiE125 gp8 family phage protein
MDMNVKASEFLALLGSINPSSQAVGTLTTGWISLANVRTILALISTGTLGALATVEPVSLLEAKAHLRVDIPDDDALITALIVAARMHAETVTRRALIAQSWKLVLDSFPGPTLIGIPWGKPFTLPGHAIILEKSQVRVVTAIQYLDMSGAIQVMPSANYTVDLTSEPCRITPVFGQIWPIPMPQIGAVEVDFSAGYAEPFVADAANSTISFQGPWVPAQPFMLSNSGGASPRPCNRPPTTGLDRRRFRAGSVCWPLRGDPPSR